MIYTTSNGGYTDMPISINDFQNTLDASKLRGFVKLSGDGAVKAYGGGFFARHFGLYSKPSAEENNAVRRAFYESVMDTYNCRGELLAFLRQELGIDENGGSTSGRQLSVRQAQDILQHVKAVVDEQNANVEERHSLLEDLAKRGFLVGAVRQHIVNSLAIENEEVAGTKLHNDEAQEIRHYAMDAATNFQARQRLFEQLQKDGLCQGEIGPQVRTMLRLNDAQAVLEPLTPKDRRAITEFAKTSSERLHAERLVEHKLPSADEVEKFVLPDKLDFCKAVLANPGASEQEISEVAMHINSATIAKEHDSWANEVKGGLAQLSADMGVDCSSLQEKMLQVLEKQMQDRFVNQEMTVPVDKEEIRGAFTSALNQMLNDRKALADGITAAATKLPATVTDYLRNAAATLPEFCKPAQLQTLLKCAEPLQAFLRAATADSATETEYLDTFDAMVASLNKGSGEYAANVTEGLADTKGSQFSKLLCEMGRLAVEAEKGQPLAENGDKLKAMMTRQIQQDKLVLDMIATGKGDYRGGKAAISALNDEVAQICEVAKHCGLEIELPPEGTPEMLTPEFDKHLECLDISRAKNIIDGKHFDITLRSAFKEAFLDSLKSSLARADEAAKYPDVEHSFTQGLKDYFRVGTGLIVGETVITRVNELTVDSESQAHKREMVGKLERFFGEDQVNGMRAARIIGDIVHQGFMGSALGGMIVSREPSDIMLSEDSEHEMDFSVQRDQDGNYNIHYTGVFNYRSVMDGGKRVWIDPSESAVRYDFDVKLSFDAQDGKPSFRFAQSPTMSGKITPMGRDLADYTRLNTICSSLGGPSFTKLTEITGVLNDLTVQHVVFETENTDDAVRLLRSRVFTQSDLTQLALLGFDDTVVKQMMLGCAGDEDTPRLGKEIIGRLLNPATRADAIRNLKEMAQPLVDAGWFERMPDIQPEALNLISVAELSTVSCRSGQSDAEIVLKFITESQDPEAKRLLIDLQSDNPETVEAAKARVQELSRMLRSTLGLKLLSAHIPGVDTGQIELIEKHIPPERYRGMLEHIVNRDEDFDQSIEGFKSILEAVQIIKKEEAAMNRGN